MKNRGMKISFLALLMALAMVLAACNGSAAPTAPAAPAGNGGAANNGPADSAAPADDGKVYTMRIGNVTAPDHILNITFEKMAAAINERSGGRIQATVYPSGQLGTLRTMTEGLQTGMLEMTTQSPGGLGSFLPIMGVLEMPYMYASHQHVYNVVDGEIGQELNAKFLEATGIRIMGYWMNLYRHTTNNVRPINTVADFKGLTIRVPETQTVMDTIANLGANAVPMAVGELYTAMSQGQVDGQENPVTVINASKYYEVQKYLSLTGHIYSPTVVMISESFYQSLPEDLRQIVEEEVHNAAAFGRTESEKLDKDLVTELSAKMAVNEISDPAAFRKAVQPVYDAMVKNVGPEAQEYFDRIAALG